MKKLTALLLSLLMLLSTAVLALLPCIGSAAAEELHTAKGGLFWLGGFPEPMDLAAVPKSADGLEDYLVEKLLAFQKEIVVSQFDLQADTFVCLYWLILNDHPELFFLHDSFGYYTSDAGVVTSILPQYSSDGSDMKQRTKVFNAAVAEVAAHADAADTQLGKALLINDYLCARYTYDHSLSNYSPEEFFRDGTGVCQAYTMAYKAVLNKLGLTSTSVYSREMNHVWNLVKLDGSWYHIDVTWNDSDYENAQPFTAHHSNFLLSDTGIKESGHYGWQTLGGQKAANTRYDDFFWTGIKTPIPVSGSGVYYVEQDHPTTDRQIKVWNVGASSSQTVHTYSIYSDNRSECYSADGYDPLCVRNGRVYYVVQHQLYSVPIGGGSRTLHYTLSTDRYNIWSMLPEGNRVTMWATPMNSFSPYELHTAYLVLPTGIRFAKAAAETGVGKSVQLTALPSPAAADVPFTWQSADPGIAKVSADGKVTGVSVGHTCITASYGNVSASCTVAVHSAAPLRLPARLGIVDEDSFRGIKAQDVIIPEGVTAIGPNAFADCTGLLLVSIPDSVAHIDPTAFASCGKAVILCTSGSAAHAFALAAGLPVILVE